MGAASTVAADTGVDIMAAADFLAGQDSEIGVALPLTAVALVALPEADITAAGVAFMAAVAFTEAEADSMEVAASTAVAAGTAAAIGKLI
jgi:hypothetical protein